jgi:excisionase family DNA binding protein
MQVDYDFGQMINNHFDIQFDYRFDSRLNEIEEKLKRKILIENKAFLTVQDAAMLMDVSKSTVYNLINKSLLPFYKINSKKVYFKLLDINDYILDHRHKSRTELKQEALEQFLNLKKVNKG